MSTHPSNIRPKRASTRFTFTREDHQLDPRKDYLQEVKVYPISCGTDGKYRLAIDGATDNICDLKSLDDPLLSTGVLHVSTLEGMLNSLLEVLPKYIARTGRSVRIGNLITLVPCVTGTIDHANDDLDPKKNHLEIRATVSPVLRHSLARVPLVNMKHKRIVIGRVTCDTDGAVGDEIDAVHDIMVFGTGTAGIYVPNQLATDENTRGRVWVETLDEELLGRCEVLSSGHDLVRARFVPNVPVEPGEVRLVVETYGTEEAAKAGDRSSLARYSRVVKFRKEPFGK